MIQNIMVGVDGEGLSDHAVTAGLFLAKKLAAECELVHSISLEPSFRDRLNKNHWAAIQADLLAKTRAACAYHLLPILDGSGFDSAWLANALHVVLGKPAFALLDRAENRHSDLLVLGAHKHRGIFDFGSTSRSIMARSHCPIWVQSQTFAAIQNILVPIDLSPNSATALALARSIAEKLGADLTVLHCFVPPDFAYGGSLADVASSPTYVVEGLQEQEQKDFENYMAEFDPRGVRVETRFAHGEPSECILQLEDSVDLIIMGTHGHTGLSRAVLGSQTYNVMKSAHRPVLAVPLQDRAYLAPPTS